MPYDTITVGGVHVGESLLGDVKGDLNWNPKTILYMTSSRDAFNVTDRFIDSEYYQVTSRDRKETRTLTINRYDPDGPKVSYSSSIRATRSDIQKLLFNPDGTENTNISMLPGDREMFMSIFDDPEFANNPFYLALGSNDAFSQSDRVITSKAYQVTARDGDTTHSLNIDDRVPEGYPVVTYQRSERMRKSDVEAILNDPANTLVPPGSTVLPSGLTILQTIQNALAANPYAIFYMTTSNLLLHPRRDRPSGRIHWLCLEHPGREP